MDDLDGCLHPYRKRKFFYALADLFREPRPAIRRLEDFFPAAAAPAVTSPAPRDGSAGDSDNTGSLDAAHDLLLLTASSAKQLPSDGATASASSPRGEMTAEAARPPSQEPEEDSFEYVDFDKSARASLDSAASLRAGRLSQSSVHDSMQDSLLFLPPPRSQDARVSLSAATNPSQFSQDVARPPTILSLAGSERHVELADYYDLDRYCEAVPCWALDGQASCALHREPIRRPVLLFSLQALDEFIASASCAGRDGPLVASCRLARMVLASMWERDVRKLSTDSDIVLSEYVTGKASVIGVAQDVWKIIDACWRAHKQNFLHDQELCFVEPKATPPPRSVEQWLRVRDLVQVYALRPELARRLEADLPPGEISLEAVRPEACTRDTSHVKAVQFGLAYVQHVHHKGADDEARPRRDVLSQSEWKVAFSAIDIHLKKSSRVVQVFPCGAFSRGAAFGSVMDVLVGLPPVRDGDDDEPPIHAVLKVLSQAKIIEHAQAHVLSQHRALAMIPFKTFSIILDVKAYRRPQSWFALLYYTGPETFTQAYFSALLKRPLSDLRTADFDHIYACVTEQLGSEEVASIDSENQLFDLINAEYIHPPHRM